MSSQPLEPLKHSNSVSKSPIAYIVSGIFLLGALGFIGLSFYLASFDGSWWVFIFFVPCALILGGIAALFYPSERRVVYSYEVNNEGIFQHWRNTKTNEEQENVILYENIEDVIVGIYADYIRMPREQGISFYRFEALLIIKYDGGKYFFERFWNKDDLHQWIARMEGKVPAIYYTDYDLKEALHARIYTEVDFTKVPVTTVDVVSEHLSKDKTRNPFTSWLPEDVKKIVQEKEEEIKKKTTNPKTIKAEKITFIAISIFNVLIAAIYIPTVPYDAEGYMEMTAGIIFGYFLINLLIPLLFVFWRNKTKWYLPFQLVFYAVISNTIGLILASITTDYAPDYDYLVVLNFFNIILWVGSFVLVKLIKYFWSNALSRIGTN